MALLPRRAQTAEESVDEGARLEQVSHGAEERCLGRWLACRHGLPTREIGPVGRNQRARAVRQDQDQTQPTLSVEAAEDFERLPFKRMMSPNDPDERGTSTWVVCRVPSTRSRIAS